MKPSRGVSVSPAERARWLTCDDAVLLASCDVDAYRASGPGGQKRNKTSSAVRLRHRPTGLIVIAEESRSQHENKARTLRRLRLAIALQVRVPIGAAAPAGLEPPPARTDTERFRVSRRRPDYAVVLAEALDAVAACEGRIKEAAELLGMTTARLSGFVTADGKLLAAVNRIRQASGLRPLRTGR